MNERKRTWIDQGVNAGWITKEQGFDFIMTEIDKNSTQEHGETVDSQIKNTKRSRKSKFSLRVKDIDWSKNNKQIAKEEDVSTGTVSNHRPKDRPSPGKRKTR